jgi:hypothetical protein
LISSLPPGPLLIITGISGSEEAELFITLASVSSVLSAVDSARAQKIKLL